MAILLFIIILYALARDLTIIIVWIKWNFTAFSCRVENLDCIYLQWDHIFSWSKDAVHAFGEVLIQKNVTHININCLGIFVHKVPLEISRHTKGLKKVISAPLPGTSFLLGIICFQSSAWVQKLSPSISFAKNDSLLDDPELASRWATVNYPPVSTTYKIIPQDQFYFIF